MRRLSNIFLFLTVALVAAAACACSGTQEEESDALKFSANKSTITADGVDAVIFTVKKSNEDVTGTSSIYMIANSGEREKLTSNSFSTKEPGTYVFEAEHSGETSKNRLTVTATGGGGTAEGLFFRKVCIMKLTQIQCSFCPAGGRKLDILTELYPDRIVEMAFHSNTMGADPMAIPETETINSIFQKAYPAAIVDLRSATDGDALYPNTKEAFLKSLESYPAVCGVKLSSVYNAASGKLSIKVNVTSDGANELLLAVYVLENELVYPDYPQKDGSLSIPEYKHHKVVRKLLSSNIMGDNLGMLTNEQEILKTYETTTDGWDVSNTHIVAYVVDKKTNTINNIAKCDADGGFADYEYNLN